MIDFTKINNINTLHRFSVLFCAASISLAPFVASLGLIAFIVSNLILAYVNRAHIKFDKIYLLLCVPFFIYLLSFTFKYDEKGAFDMLVRTLPIFILPLLVSINSRSICNLRNEIIKYYLLGLGLSCLLSISFGLYHFLLNGFNIQSLTYYELAEYLSLHPTYYSIFILTGIIFVLFQCRLKIVTNLLILLLFIITLLLLQSRMAYIILMIILGYYFFKHLKSFKVYVLPFLIILLLIIVAIPNSLSRLKELSITYNTEQELIGDNEENGISQRIWLWSNAWSHIKNKPILGNGFRSQETVFKWKVEKENLFKNRSYNYDMAAMRLAGWNLHNQYLQVLYESGFVGLIILLSSMCFLIRFTYISRNNLFLLVYLVFIAFLTTENLLDRQMGIYFYGFILPSLLCSKSS